MHSRHASHPFEGPLRRSVVEAPDGVKLTVVEAGDPAMPGLLFLHGFAQSSLSFRRQFSSDLAQRYHLVAFDHRGHGASDKPTAPGAYFASQVWADDVAAVIAAMHLDRPVLTAWSFGGYVAMDYLRHHGARGIAAINMVASTGGLVSSFMMGAASASIDGPSVSEDLEEFIGAAADTAEFFATTQTAEERRALFATEIMMPAYVRRVMATRDNSHYDLVGAIDVPMLFSTGTDDPLVPPPPTWRRSALRCPKQDFPRTRAPRISRSWTTPPASIVSSTHSPNRSSRVSRWWLPMAAAHERVADRTYAKRTGRFVASQDERPLASRTGRDLEVAGDGVDVDDRRQARPRL